MSPTIPVRAMLALLITYGIVHAEPIPARYRIIEGSTLTDDCTTCDCPTITAAIRGSFVLRLTQQDPLFSTFMIDNLTFYSFGAAMEYKGQGQGTCRVGGEVAVVQQMTLRGSINEYDNLEFDSGLVPAQAPFSWIEIDLVEVSPRDPLHTFTLHLVAVPWPRLWFSTEVGFHTYPGLVHISAGDVLSPKGQVVHTNAQLTAQLGIPPVVPDLGLDAVVVPLPPTPKGSATPEVWFSTVQDAFSGTLGSLGNGDLLSDAGAIVRHNLELIAPFAPQPPVPDLGLDAVTLGPDGTLLFSTGQGFFSQTLGRKIDDGDLLSAQGTIFRTNAQLMAAFQPIDPVPANFGLDAAYVWPFGEVWFSTKASFVDLRLGPVGKGDLLSDAGRVVARNRELLEIFSPIEDLADFGLDALQVFLPVQFAGCGVIAYGPLNCLLFQADSGGLYVLDNFGGFGVGDRVYVSGFLNPELNCAAGCLGISGCIEDNTISAPVPADFDCDQDVDLNDLAVFQACVSGPTVAHTDDCAKADFDRDADVDLNDFGIFQRCYSGPDHPADMNCAIIRPYITGLRRSDCKPGDPQTTGDYPWCGQDELELAVEGRSLRMTHRNATYNCCLDDIAVTLDSQGARLRFLEQEVLTFPCFCLCCYDVTTTVGGLTPGVYTVEYCWVDEESGPTCLVKNVTLLP